jgi:hypothetical protein
MFRATITFHVFGPSNDVRSNGLIFIKLGTILSHSELLHISFLQTITDEYKSPLTSTLLTRWACSLLNVGSNNNVYVCNIL